MQPPPRKMRQRPDQFRLNPRSPLAEGLVAFWGGGLGCAGSMTCPDATRHLGADPADGDLTDMQAATAWGYSSALGRQGVFTGGTAEHVSASIAPLTAPLTISLWCQVAGGVTGKCAIGVGVSGDTSEQTYQLYPSMTGNVQLSTRYKAWAFDNTGFAALAAGEDAHLAFTVSATSLRFAKNGVFGWQSARTKTPDPATGANLGHRIDDLVVYAGYGHVGWLHDVLIHSRVLSDAEVAALADPVNVDLRVGGVPLVLPPRRRAFRTAAVSSRRRRLICGVAA